MKKGAAAEVHRDTDYLFTGTHKGASGTLILSDNGKYFASLGVMVGLAIANDTDGSSGLVTAVADNTVTCTLSGGTANTWTTGDTYYIYKTAAYNTKISTTYTDKIYGQKVTDPAQLYKGQLADDADLDIDHDHVWGPGQPYSPERY